VKSEISSSSAELMGVGDASVFPVLNGVIYLDHAAVSPLPAPTANAMRRYLDAWERFGSKAWGYETTFRVRRSAATLIGAISEEEVCVVPNTSTGLATVARGLQLGQGDSVVVPDMEFPANRFVWEDLGQDGANVAIVPHRPTLMVEDDDLIAAMRSTFRRGSTNVLAVSHVQFATGQRHDVARLAQAAHELGGLICVDAIQSIGQMIIDVEAAGIDFAAADGHKWMLGPEGVGILYCRRNHLERLRPPVIGWLNMMDAASFSADHMILRRDARRFEAGCYNVGGVQGLAASLELLLAVGVGEIERRLGELSTVLREGALRAGFDVIGGQSRILTSGIVSLRPTRGAMPNDIERLLEHRGIRIAVRKGLLRISPHYYNTTEQISQTLAALGEVNA
jgi:cysteine desulfurase / selenocysteine lyase